MRINFEFSEQQVKALKELQQKTGSSSMKEMFNSAMSLLEWAVDETAKQIAKSIVFSSCRSSRRFWATSVNRRSNQSWC